MYKPPENERLEGPLARCGFSWCLRNSPFSPCVRRDRRDGDQQRQISQTRRSYRISSRALFAKGFLYGLNAKAQPRGLDLARVRCSVEGQAQIDLMPKVSIDTFV